MTIAKAHEKLVKAESLVREARDILALHLLKVDEIALGTIANELKHMQLVADNLHKRERHDANRGQQSAEL